MITIQECYLYVKDRLNNQSSNANQEVTAHTFIRTMRAATYFWLDERLKVEEVDSTRQREISNLLVTKLINGQKRDGYNEFVKPTDFYHRSGFRVQAKKGKCENVIEGVLVETANLPSYLGGDDTRPNFEWEQTLVTFGSNKIFVWFRDFDINKLILTYYRKPVEVDIAGYDHVGGTPSTNVNPEFDDSSVYEILNLTAMILAGDTSSPKIQALMGLAKFN